MVAWDKDADPVSGVLLSCVAGSALDASLSNVFSSSVSRLWILLTDSGLFAEPLASNKRVENIRYRC